MPSNELQSLEHCLIECQHELIAHTVRQLLRRNSHLHRLKHLRRSHAAQAPRASDLSWMQQEGGRQRARQMGRLFRLYETVLHSVGKIKRSLKSEGLQERAHAPELSLADLVVEEPSQELEALVRLEFAPAHHIDNVLMFAEDHHGGCSSKEEEQFEKILNQGQDKHRSLF